MYAVGQKRGGPQREKKVNTRSMRDRHQGLPAFWDERMPRFGEQDQPATAPQSGRVNIVCCSGHGEIADMKVRASVMRKGRIVCISPCRLRLVTVGRPRDRRLRQPDPASSARTCRANNAHLRVNKEENSGFRKVAAEELCFRREVTHRKDLTRAEKRVKSFGSAREGTVIV